MEKNASGLKHILVIDSLRGLAAFSVLLFHFVCKTKDFVHSEFILELFSYGKLGVYMFFVISGIVIPLSLINNGYKVTGFSQFLLKRIVRLDPPYFIALALGIGLVYVRQFVPGVAQVNLMPSVKEVILHIGYLIPFFKDVQWLNPAFWTLAIEFQYYIVLALTIVLLKSPDLFKRSIAYVIYLGGALIYFAFPSYELLPPFLPIFLLGIVYCTRQKQIISKTEYMIVTLLSIVLGYIANSLEVISTAVLTLGIIHFLPQLRTKLTLFLGKISYSLYLMHGIFAASFVNYLSHYTHTAFSKISLLAGGILIAIVSAWVLSKYVEEPSKSFSARLFKQK